MDLSVDLNGLKLKNPITVASGTFGFAREYSEFIDLNDLGAISVKGLTLKPRIGNDAPRVAETPMGMLNCVGLQNPGVYKFIEEELPFLKEYDTKIIANINGNTIEEYEEITEIISNTEVDSIELNISCPNVKCGGMAFGTDPLMVSEVVRKVRNKTKKHLIVKLSPNVKNITEIALAAEIAGADCISMINTISGMKIDIKTMKPLLGNISGGLSGPAVKPVAVKMIYDTYKMIKIPILGMGGISSEKDVIEFILAGAKAVAIGTANFTNPYITKEILENLKKYLQENNLTSLNSIWGKAHY
ncbi:dihydroorotate dehydrogenase [Helicovermis profundi]|uniref:Dihydroorotate dehydrogenase n=1 Tax=Helicovermis profundi TaxID=3065157 RepID=A0AAU9EH19_9FIRM|nr:dihydroorotate dehydrogenase [Clostridia bacterium S502]